MTELLTKVTPEIISIAIGFAMRHFLMPLISGKETSHLIKYLKNHQITKEQQAELNCNLSETRLWIELHSQSCPYVKKELREAKETVKKLFNQGKS
jgi:5-bromo-4-chloroindolyl phosphate hydrolysis protein